MSKLYLNAVLTVIAICLAVIAFRETVAPAHAQTGPVHVYVDGVSSYAFQFAGPLTVRAQ
jgi:hypothetical protein